MNNIKPYFWGPHYWKTIFSMCASYPENPDSNFLRTIKEYMLSLQILLPCQSCRESYIKYGIEVDTELKNDNNYSSKDNFIEFIFKLRNKINNKLGLDYKITLKYFKLKINNMICSKYHNIDAYTNNIVDAPFIQDSVKDDIYTYLDKQQVDIRYTRQLVKKLLEFYNNPNFDENNNLFKLWLIRNSICEEIIKKIYNNMACYDYDINISFKRDKEFHIKLFSLGCSIIPYSNIKKLLSK
jgi:hypothetical protein